MIFHKIGLEGALLVELQKREDERGFFARSWCRREFEEYGLETGLVQCNISFSPKMGTLRGMHYQQPPYAEVKLVRCTRGAFYDVIIDLRPNSPTFLQWHAVELTSENRYALYVPKGFAHGFQTLENNSEVFYQITEFYAPDWARGVRWNDPLFNIAWPLGVSMISPRDATYPNCDPRHFSVFLNND